MLWECRIDATCAPSYVRYPTDTSLLNEAREKTEQLIDELHVPGSAKPRTYRKKASKKYKNFARKRKPKRNEIRRAKREQLGYLRRNIKSIEKMLSPDNKLSVKSAKIFETIKKLYEQQLEMYTKNTKRVPDRIVSLYQPWLRPIVTWIPEIYGERIVLKYLKITK